MDFNSVLNKIGGYGKFQKLLLFVFFNVVNVYGSLSYWAQLFILLVPDHTCRTSLTTGPNSTTDDWFAGQCSWKQGKTADEFSTNVMNKSAKEIFMPARGFPVYMASFFGMGDLFDDSNDTMSPTIESLGCDDWSYDFSVLFPTAASDNNWVCRDSWKVSFAHTCYWIGSTLGYLTAGFMLDSLGRRPSIAFFTTTLGISHIISIFAPNYPSFVLSRLLAGMSALPLQSSAYTLAVELISPSKRKVAAVSSAIYWLGLAVIFPWMAYVIRDWKILLIISSSPFIVLVPLIIWSVPESPSWLLGRGEIERAKSELIKISKINGTYDESFFETLKLSEPKQTQNAKPDGFIKTTILLVKTRNIRKKTLVLFVAWLFICMSYHGVNLSQSSAGSHVYMIYSLGSLLEIPVCFLHLMLVDRVGRRLPIILALALVGILGPTTSYINSGSMWVSFSVSIIIRGLFSLAYNIFFQLSAELFPTTLRGRGICLMRALGDIGTSVAPFIISTAAKTDTSLPVFVFSALAIIGGGFTLLLPETLNQPLPQTVQDADDFGLDQGLCFCPAFNSRLKPSNNDQPLKCKNEDGADNPGFVSPKIDEIV